MKKNIIIGVVLLGVSVFIGSKVFAVSPVSCNLQEFTLTKTLLSLSSQLIQKQQVEISRLKQLLGNKTEDTLIVGGKAKKVIELPKGSGAVKPVKK